MQLITNLDNQLDQCIFVAGKNKHKADLMPKILVHFSSFHLTLKRNSFLIIFSAV